MTTKVDTYTQMADRATKSLTAQIRDWSRFLLLAGQFYKYNFLDQVMIYAQRPSATACAEFDLWTRRMGRRIRYGSKGIVLLRFRDGKTSLRYVFDVADTERRENARDPMPWVYREEYQVAVTSWLEKCFHAPGDAGLDKQLIHLAVQFSEEYWHDFKDDILRAAQGSVLGERSEDDIAVHFRTIMTASLAFLLLARCGFDLVSFFSPDDFDSICEFNTANVVLALGSAVNKSAGVILRQIEYAIRKYEQDQAAGALPPAAPPKDVSPSRIEIPAPKTSDTGAAAGDAKPAAAPVYFSEPEPPAQEHSTPHKPAAVPVHPLKPVANAHNFRITDDHLGEGGPKAKFQMNTAAIRTLKQIETEGRNATPAEQEVLSRYVGWGGVPDAFDPVKEAWSAEYAELKSLLTPEEYAAARASTLNAHYTSPTVIRAIYEAVGNMGFTAGNVLEPSCGVGSFFGLLPERMAASKLYGVELDPKSGLYSNRRYFWHSCSHFLDNINETLNDFNESIMWGYKYSFYWCDICVVYLLVGKLEKDQIER